MLKDEDLPWPDYALSGQNMVHFAVPQQLKQLYQIGYSSAKTAQLYPICVSRLEIQVSTSTGADATLAGRRWSSLFEKERKACSGLPSIRS